MKRRLWHLSALLVALAAIAAACSLNPQPLPPGLTDDGGLAASPLPDAATMNPLADASFSPTDDSGGGNGDKDTGPAATPEGGQDASPSDASSDATTDAPSDAPSDAADAGD